MQLTSMMKPVLTLALVLAAVATVCVSSIIRVDPRSNLNVGVIGPRDRRLHSGDYFRAASVNAVQTQDVAYRGNSTTRITAVQATEIGLSQNATARIVSGGVGWSNTTVRFQSARGRGWNYRLVIWGH